jgi:hypothetical protein
MKYFYLLIVALLSYVVQIQNLMDLMIILMVNLLKCANQPNMDALRLVRLLFFFMDQILKIFLIDPLLRWMHY